MLKGFLQASAVKRNEVSYRRAGGVMKNILAEESGT